ncbi:MAG: hypothetical protein LWY06_20350, partial [Firmicutes bacterium]|nr:hypothetical protein [Bacillota bacterium]
MDAQEKTAGPEIKRKTITDLIKKIMLVILILFALYLFFVLSNFSIYNQRIKKYNACVKNVKLLESALEDFAKNNSGHYPGKLEDLVPEYISEIPACPEAGRDTYSESYKWVSGWNDYSFCCKGKNHKGYQSDIKLFGASLFKGINPGEDTPSCDCIS